MESWIKFWTQRRGQGPATGHKKKDSYIHVAPEPASTDGDSKENWLLRWRPNSRRDVQIASLQSGFLEIRNLLSSIREHLDLQQDIQRKIVGVLEQIPTSMDGLKNISQAAGQQVEVLGILRNQVEASAQHDQQLIESMNRFNQTLGFMDETSRNASKTISDLIDKSRESEILLREVVLRSERRILLVIVAFLILMMGGAAAVIHYELTGSWLPKQTPATRVAPVTASPDNTASGTNAVLQTSPVELLP
jgi:hypothetical protein